MMGPFVFLTSYSSLNVSIQLLTKANQDVIAE